MDLFTGMLVGAVVSFGVAFIVYWNRADGLKSEVDAARNAEITADERVREYSSENQRCREDIHQKQKQIMDLEEENNRLKGTLSLIANFAQGKTSLIDCESLESDIRSARKTLTRVIKDIQKD